jgi:hypothetical protein
MSEHEDTALVRGETDRPGVGDPTEGHRVNDWRISRRTNTRAWDVDIYAHPRPEEILPSKPRRKMTVAERIALDQGYREGLGLPVERLLGGHVETGIPGVEIPPKSALEYFVEGFEADPTMGRTTIAENKKLRELADAHHRRQLTPGRSAVSGRFACTACGAGYPETWPGGHCDNRVIRKGRPMTCGGRVDWAPADDESRRRELGIDPIRADQLDAMRHRDALAEHLYRVGVEDVRRHQKARLEPTGHTGVNRAWSAHAPDAEGPMIVGVPPMPTAERGSFALLGVGIFLSVWASGRWAGFSHLEAAVLSLYLTGATGVIAKLRGKP